MDNNIIEIIAANVEALSDSDSFSLMGDGQNLPSADVLSEIVKLTQAIIFPGYFGQTIRSVNSIKHHIGANMEQLYLLLCDQISKGLGFDFQKESHEKRATQIATKFIQNLTEIKRQLLTDIEAVFMNDPAAKSYGEVILCYPGITAITHHRIAHALLKDGVPVIPRIISEMSHSKTGIDIHPAAQIDDYFSIDHGTGVVIGQTAIIGKHVHIYQGVTLGAKSFSFDEKGHAIDLPRHPIIEDNVTIYSNTSILGRVTIGKGSIIGGNIWIATDVAPNSKVLKSILK